MSNNNQAPQLHPISKIEIPHFEQYLLDNDIPLYVVNMGTQPVFKLEIIFEAGRFHEDKRLVSNLTSRMLKEGTTKYTGAQIAEQIDFFAGTLGRPVNFDSPSIVLYGLVKHFENLIPILAEILSSPTFPQEELKNYIAEKKQELQVNLTKTDVIAYRTVTEAIFGTNHPYGYNSVAKDYDKISQDDLINHFKQHYVQGNCKIILSGQITDKLIQLINSVLIPGIQKGKSSPNFFDINPYKEKSIYIKKENAVQTAIRLGRKLFTQHHEDYAGLFVLNTIFGDYFGSRLMSNIREDKGYTYNIYSMIDIMKREGSLIIGTEISSEHTTATLKEIIKETKILQETLVSQEELTLVKNYLMGTFLNWVDGPFNVASIVKTLILSDLNIEYFNTLIDTTKEISPKQIQLLAQKYLNLDDFYQVIVGK